MIYKNVKNQIKNKQCIEKSLIIECFLNFLLETCITFIIENKLLGI